MDINHSKEPRTDNPTVPEAGQAVREGAEMVEKPCCCAVGNKQAEIVQKPPSMSDPPSRLWSRRIATIADREGGSLADAR